MTGTRFHLYTSNNLQALAKEYSEERKKHSERFCAGGFFAKERICVATKGMGTWLEHYLVDAGHVVANVEFPFIRDVIDEILATFMSGKTAYRPELFKEDVLIWRLYRLLNLEALKGDDRLKILSAYIEADIHDSVRRYQLAQKLAQLYYDYMVFVPEKLHPELIPKNAKLDTSIAENNKWQLALWQKLCVADDGSAIISPAAAMLQFIIGKEPLNKNDYTPMTFFGISAMAPYFLWVLRKVATVQPVNFFYLNHCDELWDSVKAHWEKHDDMEAKLTKQFDSTLLGEFGTQGRQFFKAIMDLDTDVVPHELGDERLEQWDDFDYDSLPRTDGIDLLQDIQTRILHNTDEKTTQTVRPQEQDDSLTIHSCFNDVREVEALHDCLLQLINEYKASGKPLTMNDIIVMAPDIARFAPTIQAVFGKGPLKSKFCISDRSVKSASLMAEAFQNIMTLHKGRFEISRISKLLDSPPLRARFDFDDDDVQKLRDWFRKAGIRWGRDKNDRGSDDAAFEEYSWQYGLDRLLLKIAVDGIDAKGHDIIGFGDLNPVDTSMGQDSQQLLNSLCRFYRELDDFVGDIQKSADEPRNGAEWCDYLLAKREAFFRADSDSAQEYSHLGRTCTEMKEAMITAGCNEALPYDVIVSAMSTKLEAPAKGEPFLNGKITFCSLLPMRGIPCKVIALLGMDVGEFPRQNDATSYNLVLKPVGSDEKPASGNLLKYYDRSRSIEDRFTFLEALMSAQDYLMIFYKGQDDQTLENLVAAAPVVELLNYVRKIRPQPKDKDAKSKDKESSWPLVKHMLNSFDPKVFTTAIPCNNGDTESEDIVKQPSGALLKAFSYDKEMWRIATKMKELADNARIAKEAEEKARLAAEPEKAAEAAEAAKPENAAEAVEAAEAEELEETQEDEAAPAEPRHEMWLDAYQLPLPKTLPHGWQDKQTLNIDLQDLIQFYKNPQDAYMTSRLGFPKTEWEEEQLSDYEPFKLNKLQATFLKKDIAVAQLALEKFAPLNEQSPEELKRVYQSARGQCGLPAGAMSQVEYIAQQIESWIPDPTFRQEWQEQEDANEETITLPLDEIKAALPDELKLYDAIKDYSRWGDAFPRPQTVSFNVTLTGRIKYLHAKGDRPCGFRQYFGVHDMHGRHFHPFYLKHLFLTAAKENEEVVSTYYKDASDKPQSLGRMPCAKPTARQQLIYLVQTYLFGNLYPIPLFGKGSIIGARGGLPTDDLKKDLKKINASVLFNQWALESFPEEIKTLLNAFIKGLFPSLEMKPTSTTKSKKQNSTQGKGSKKTAAAATQELS